MKEILFLAYHFPPAQNGAVARFYAYYRHLQKFGYKPVIITVNNFGQLREESDVYRFNSLAEVERKPLYKRFYFKKVKKFIYDKFDPTLDFRWRRAVKNGIDKIISQHDFAAVLSSFPHAESFNLGIFISQKYGIPLISEFRDGYAFESVINTKSSLAKRFIQKFEKKVIDNSSLIITVTEGLTDYIKKTYKMDKAFTVFNGYEALDFEGLDKIKFQPDNTKIKVINFGSMDISGNRDVGFLYNALYKLKQDNIINESKFELSLVGKYSQKEKQLIDSLELNDIVKIYDPVPKSDGFKLITEKYHYLLLYGLPGISHNIPSKLFEYINLNKPIIGICKGNESTKIIESTGTGETCGFDVNEIAELFGKAMHGGIKYEPSNNIIRSYSRENQVMAFSGILKNNGI